MKLLHYVADRYSKGGINTKLPTCCPLTPKDRKNLIKIALHFHGSSEAFKSGLRPRRTKYGVINIIF